MKKRFTCEHGHQWEAAVGGSPLAVEAICCPECGAAAETLPPESSPVEPGSGDTAKVMPQTPPKAAAQGTTTPRKAAVAIPKALANHPRYRILATLGAGGMGTVYKAEHRLMERTVALKVIAKGLFDSPDAIERFRREVKAASRLSDPHIVTAYDAEQEGDTHFLVMEYVDGVSLAEWLEKKGPLPVAQACHFVRQAALGLQHAHERGMVHRDIKPQNLMLTRKGQVKILDFGLARLAREKTTDAQLTQDGCVMGTPDYIAPEQATDARTADIRADIYSLGCTLYHLLAGRVPFPDGSFFTKLTAHQSATPRPIGEIRPEVPSELTAVVERMMAKDPSRRFQTPAEVARALAPFVSAGATPALSEKPWWKRPATLIAAALLLIAVLVIGAVLTLKTKHGTLTINVPEPDVKVLIDGDEKIVIDSKKVGRVELSPGPHQLAVKRGDEELYTDSFVLKRGGEVVIDAKWQPRTAATPKAETGTLTVNVPEADVKVFIDGGAKAILDSKKAGPLELSPGPHKVVVKRGDEELYSKAFDLKPGGDLVIDAAWAPKSPQPAKKNDDSDGFVAIFNGKDLTGWTIWGPRVWTTDKGEIVVSGTGDLKDSGWLMTDRDYENFVFKFEFLMFPGSDSGVSIRLAPFEGPGPFFKIRDETKFKMRTGAMIFFRDGSQFIGPDRKDKLSPLGSWNEMVLDVQGPIVRVSLNGDEIHRVDLNELDKTPHTTPNALKRAVGRIALQNLGGVVRFRNIRVKDLAGQPPTSAPGTVTVNVPEAGVKVFIDRDQKAVLDSKKSARLQLPAGSHSLQVKRGDEVLFSEAFTLKPGGDLVIHAAWQPKPPAPVAESWTPLFNGKDLTGWKVQGGDPEKWNVEDGLIIAERPNSAFNWLMTDREYGDFEFRLEYRLPEQANSGVALRAGPTGDPAFQGMEIQLLEGPKDLKLRPEQLHGAIYDVLAPAKQAAKTPGQWNQMHIVAQGRRVVVRLNGVAIQNADVDSFKDKEAKHPGLLRRTGRLGLQSHHGTVGRLEFRKLEVKELKQARVDDRFVPLLAGNDFAGWDGARPYWTLKDGVLKVATVPNQRNFNPCLCSRKTYRDFELHFEARLTGNSNSGVQIRSQVVDRDKFVVRGPQVDMGTGVWGGLWGEGMNTGWLLKAPDGVAEKALRANQFDRWVVRCVGKRVTIQINGTTTVDDVVPKLPDTGIIAWQIHGRAGTQATFRNIRIRELN